MRFLPDSRWTRVKNYWFFQYNQPISIQNATPNSKPSAWLLRRTSSHRKWRDHEANSRREGFRPGGNRQSCRFGHRGKLGHWRWCTQGNLRQGSRTKGIAEGKGPAQSEEDGRRGEKRLFQWNMTELPHYLTFSVFLFIWYMQKEVIISLSLSICNWSNINLIL